MITVDLHCHFIAPAFVEELERRGSSWGARLERAGDDRFIRIQDWRFGPITQRFFDPKARVEDMARQGIALQVVSASPQLFYYWAEPELGIEVARLTNDAIAALVQTDPGRFAGMATVPLQDCAAAIRELDRAADELGFRAVEIGTHVNCKNLDDEALAPFFQRASERGMLVFVHPHHPAGEDRMRRHFLSNLVGFPLETTLAAGSLIFGGVLERYRDLRVCLSHCGGYLFSAIGRLDRAFATRPDCRTIPQPPSEYLRRLYFDTICFSHRLLEMAAKTAGADRLVIGTDYPFAMAEEEPVAFIQAAPGLGPEEKAAILGGNALRALGLA
ncbi:MAG: amidohydrolase [Deltaproteobacteria bacterium]|nr:amidohydrolase [Deltaproteobacteria bacterium]